MSLDEIEVIGERLETCIRPFVPHADRSRQAGWRLDGADTEAIERAVRILRDTAAGTQTRH